MFVYEKRLQYPVRIKQTNPRLAKIIITQYGGAYCKSYDYINKKHPRHRLMAGEYCKNFDKYTSYTLIL